MQCSLFGFVQPAIDLAFSRSQREELGKGAWLEHVPGWLSGDLHVFAELSELAEWRQQSRVMYERRVEVPRLVAELPRGGQSVSLVRNMAQALSKRYHRHLDQIALAYYRDGRDSVAPHGDKMGSLIPSTVIGIVSLGEPRRFTLRANDGGLRRVFALGCGDLLVMGGSCQQHFMHGIPKLERAGPRISIQFRERVPDMVRHPATLFSSVRAVPRRLDDRSVDWRDDGRRRPVGWRLLG